MGDNTVSRHASIRDSPAVLTTIKFGFESSMDFANPGNGNMDVLQDFDFDSFLHQDGDNVDNFNFDTSAFLDNDGIGI